MAQEMIAELREDVGTRSARRLRRAGLVPATLYGHGRKAVSIKLNRRELERAVERGERLLALKIGSETATQALIKGLQHDAIGGHIIHADFTEVAMDEKVSVTVPLVLHGTPAGVKEGGTVDQIIHEVEVECLAASIPQEIRIEIAELNVGDQITAGQLDLPDGVTTGLDPNDLVVVVRAPVGEEEEEAAVPEEGEAAMPEVITERKEDEPEGGATEEKKG